MPRRALTAIALALVTLGLCVLALRLTRMAGPELSQDVEAERDAVSPGRWALALPAQPKAAPPDLQSLPHAVNDASLSGGAASGWVLEAETHAPIPNAQLAFEGAGGIHIVTTTADGRFDFRPPKPGDFALVALVAPGREPVVREVRSSDLHLTLSPGRRVEGIRLRMPHLKACRGRVALEDGGVAPDARLERLWPDPGKSPIAFVSPPLTADDAGVFEFLGGEYEGAQATLAGLAPAQGLCFNSPFVLTLVHPRSSSLPRFSGSRVDGLTGRKGRDL